MNPDDLLLDDDGLDALLDAIADGPPAPVGWTALPAAFADLPGVGCWYRPGPGYEWWPLTRAEWVWYRAVARAEGQYVRRTK